MNAKVSVFVTCAKVIIHLLAYNLPEYAFNSSKNRYKTMHKK